jgi:PAS domain S-box-containing protein
VRWLTWQGRTFFSETPSGRVPVRRLGACIDITERKLAEISLRESENKFSTMFKASPHGLAITTFDEGRYLEANPAESVLTGYTRKELIGRTAIELGFLLTPKTARNKTTAAESGKVNNYKFRFEENRKILGLLSASLIEFEGKSVSIDRLDISEPHKVEEASNWWLGWLPKASVGLDWNIRSNCVTTKFITVCSAIPQEFTLSWRVETPYPS